MEVTGPAPVRPNHARRKKPHRLPAPWARLVAEKGDSSVEATVSMYISARFRSNVHTRLTQLNHLLLLGRITTKCVSTNAPISGHSCR